MNQMNFNNQMNMLNMAMNNNPMKMNNPMLKINMMNNPMAINNMMNMPINNMMNINMPINNMMGNQMAMNNMMNIPMFNMMSNPIPTNNMMNNQMAMNNMMNMPMNNMMNNQMNNMMNMQMNNMMNNQMNKMMIMQMNNMLNMQMNNMMNMQMNNMMNMPIQSNNQIVKNGPLAKKEKKSGKRKIPPILLKNANIKIERITFQVEKGLKKARESFGTRSINTIFKELFSKRKKIIDEKGQKRFLNENEPMEIIHYKFDTNETNFFNCGKKSLIQGLVLAYKNHFPITVSPDMIWLLILQGYSKFMDKYSELVREKYVNFKGQKTLMVDRMGTWVHSATEDDWNGIIDEFVEQIGEHIGEETISKLQSDFSTTNSVTLFASQASIMSAMKHYFKYELAMGGCGISYITLEGSLEDWNKIKSKLQYLSNFALNWWTKHLIPIIDNIIATKKYFSQNNKINQELIDFWKKMIRIKDKKDEYEPDVINGWIINFIPDLSGEHPKLYKEINEFGVPDQIISCPLKISEYNTLNKVVYNCDIASGFFGMTQDKKSLTVKPVIGYAIVVEDKEILPLSLEEKENIINQFFN